MGLGSVDGFHPPQGHGRVAGQVARANNNFVVAAKRLLGGEGGSVWILGHLRSQWHHQLHILHARTHVVPFFR